MQLMNVAAGGTLNQHVPDSHGHEDHRRSPGSFDDADHDVRLEPGSLAARAAGEQLHATKSHHHQAVAALGDGLVASGWSVLDDLVEAIEVPDARWALGVQWHPEADPRSGVVAALVAAAQTAAVSSRPRTASASSSDVKGFGRKAVAGAPASRSAPSV
jgi:putative glutamine amidotransferase